MGLFGGKKEVNVQDLLKKLSETGGDGIFKIPIQVFTKYLHENGELITQSGYNGIEGFLDIGGKKHKVEFRYGLNEGCEEGETYILISEHIGTFDDIDNIDLKSIADKLSIDIKQFIANEKDACKLAFHIFCMSNMEYHRQNKEGKFPNEEQYPALLQSFINKVSDDDLGALKEEYTHETPHLNFHKINAVFKSLTRDVSDLETKLRINYAIAENIIQEWDLDK
tara:strand:- start:32 stop:703 length:672 start_codon:yes stop_codon:yes gene_type:complete